MMTLPAMPLQRRKPPSASITWPVSQALSGEISQATIAGDKPGDDRGDVLRASPAAGREGGAQALVQLGRGPARVDRPRVQRVDGDAAPPEFVGERARRLVEGALAEDVRQLAGHRSQVLAGDHEEDPAAGSRVVVAFGKGSGEQDRRAGVDGPGAVELVGGDVGEGLL